MSIHPWMKFYPRDWRGDQALRMVSLAARGLWIDCMTIMHEAMPYGHLLLNGKPVTDDGLARLVGSSAEEVRRLIDELIEAGVATQNKHGVIQSRRMIRDYARSKKGQNSVKRRYVQDVENKDKLASPSRVPSSTPTTQKPEARKKKSKKEKALPSDCPLIEDQEKALAYWRKKQTPANLEEQIMLFRAHHQKIDSEFVNWSSAWVTWYGHASKFHKGQAGHPVGKPFEHWKATEPTADNSFDWLKAEAHYYNFGKWPSDAKGRLDECPPEIMARVKEAA